MLLELEKRSACCCFLWRRDDAFSPRDGEHVRICHRSCHQQRSGSGSSQAGSWGWKRARSSSLIAPSAAQDTGCSPGWALLGNSDGGFVGGDTMTDLGGTAPVSAAYPAAGSGCIADEVVAG